MVQIDAGRASGANGVVLFCPVGPCVDVRADFCTSANLFCKPGHLAAWGHNNGEPEGTVFDLNATAARGRRMWAPHVT